MESVIHGPRKRVWGTCFFGVKNKKRPINKIRKRENLNLTKINNLDKNPWKKDDIFSGDIAKLLKYRELYAFCSEIKAKKSLTGYINHGQVHFSCPRTEALTLRGINLTMVRLLGLPLTMVNGQLHDSLH